MHKPNVALRKKMIQKSLEAFMVAIELYNKPTIKYRVEGFSLFICNAWELLLKAHLIRTQGIASIYYKDNTERTKTLENCIKMVFTNESTPIRKNLEKIIELRNVSTHFITEEYEMIYIPLFQASVYNYIEKAQEWFGINVANYVQPNFLVLSVNVDKICEDDIRAKYPKEIANKLMAAYDTINPMVEQSSSGFAIKVVHNYYITKDKNKATAVVSIARDSGTDVKIIKDIRDPNETHKYNMKKCLVLINKRLETAGVILKHQGREVHFNKYHFALFCDYYDLKSNPQFCYENRLNSQPTYGYSVPAIDFIVSELSNDPGEILDNIKMQLSKKQKKS